MMASTDLKLWDAWPEKILYVCMCVRLWENPAFISLSFPFNLYPLHPNITQLWSKTAKHLDRFCRCKLHTHTTKADRNDMNQEKPSNLTFWQPYLLSPSLIHPWQYNTHTYAHIHEASSKHKRIRWAALNEQIPGKVSKRWGKYGECSPSIRLQRNQ